MENQSPYRILCLTGQSCSGKSTMASKLIRDKKYTPIVITDDDRKNQSTQELINNLIRKVKDSQSPKILLQGFPLNKKQAILFQTQFVQFQLIILFECSYQTLLTRKLSKHKDQVEQQFKTTLQSNQSNLQELVNFYTNFGLLYKIKNQDNADQVYENVKNILLPRIIFLYGPPKNGKTIIAKQLQSKTSYTFVSLRNFYKARQNKPRLQIVNEFIAHLKNFPQKCFVVDDFLETKDQYLIFQKEMGNPQKVYYLDSHKDEVQISISTKCQPKDKQANRKIYLTFVENRKKLLEVIKDQPFFKKIIGNQSSQEIQKQIVNDMKPTVVAAYFNTQQEAYFLKQFQSKAGWKIIDIQEMKIFHSQRKTQVGKKVTNAKNGNKVLPLKVSIDILRDCLFGKSFRKIILVNLGDKIELYKSIEQQLFKIGLLQIEFEKKGQFKEAYHPLLHYFEQGKLYKIRQKKTQLLDAMLQSSIKYGLLFGPPSSGKTTLVKNISKKFGMIEVDWESTIQKVKQKEQDAGDDQLPNYKILNYLRSMFMNNLDKTFILDGVSDDKMLSQIKRHLGNPSFILNKRISKEALIQRTRQKQESDLTADVTQEQTQKITQALQKGELYVKWAEQISQSDANIKAYSLDDNGSLQNILNEANQIFAKRVYIVYNQEEETNSVVKSALINLFRNIAYNNDILYINVDQLVIRALDNNTSLIGNLLRNEYQLRSNEQLDKYSAQTYSPSVVSQLIKKHIDDTNQQYKDYMLVDYPKPKKVADSKFPLISDQLAAIENNLGEIRVVIGVAKKDLQFLINDPLLELQKPKLPEPVVAQEGQQQQPPAEQKPNDDQPKKPVFSIFDYEWSNPTEGKTIAQWYCNLKPYTDKIKSTMSNYDDTTLYSQFIRYVEDVKKNSKSYYFLQMIRPF